MQARDDASESRNLPEAGGESALSNSAADMEHRRLIDEYRHLIIEHGHHAQEAYDRTVISLSGGALGISFAFLNQFLGGHTPSAVPWLGTAWFAWVASLTSTLFSHYLSALAHNAALKELNSGAPTTLSDRLDWWTTLLNAIGGLSFLAGVICAGIFVVFNLKGSQQ